MSIHLNPDSVQIETIKDGKKTLKNTNLDNVQKMLTRNQKTESPFLPGQWGTHKWIKNNNRELFAMSTPPHVRTVYFDFRGENGEREPKPFEIPLPAFLWLFSVEYVPTKDTYKYLHGMAYALKNPLLSENDRLWQWPFANVAHYMCWGSSAPQLGKSKGLQTLPDQFLTNPFNSDLDRQNFVAFDDKVKGQVISRFRTMQFFEYLDAIQKEAKKKGTEASFKYDALKPSLTFKEAIQNEAQQYIR